MERFSRFVSNFLTIDVKPKITSYPILSIEAILVFIVSLLNGFLVYRIYRGEKVKSQEKMRAASRNQEVLNELFGKDSSIPDDLRSTTTTLSHRTSTKRASTSSPTDPIIYSNPHLSKAEQLLTISPGEYIRQVQQRRNWQNGVLAELKSLISIVDTFTNDEGRDRVTAETIRRSITNIKESLECNLGVDCSYKYVSFAETDLDTLLGKSRNEGKSSKHSLPSIDITTLESLKCDESGIETSQSSSGS